MLQKKKKKKKDKKHFDIKLVMPVEDKRRFQSSTKCWICNILFIAGNNKVRDHDHIIEKYRGSAHRSCNINLKFTK